MRQAFEAVLTMLLAPVVYLTLRHVVRGGWGY